MSTKVANKLEILDKVFRSPDVKHGLKLFPVEEQKRLNVWEESGKPYI